MNVVLLVMTDGRGDCLDRTLASFDDMVSGPITYRVIHDDSGDPGYRSWLQSSFPGFTVIGAGHRVGFSAAYGNAWRHLAGREEHFVAAWEDDFTVDRPVDLTDLARLLDDRPHLAQVALRRQAVGHEIPHGGFMEMYPDWYVDCADGDVSWVETTRNFTTNPSLYRRQLCETGWPDREHSEGRYGFQLRERGLPWGIPGEDVRFGFWGSKADSPRVRHIGDVRVGTGY